MTFHCFTDWAPKEIAEEKAIDDIVVCMQNNREYCLHHEKRDNWALSCFIVMSPGDVLSHSLAMLLDRSSGKIDINQLNNSFIGSNLDDKTVANIKDAAIRTLKKLDFWSESG